MDFTAAYNVPARSADTAPVHELAAELAGELSPAETRVLEDACLDRVEGDPFAVLVGIVADHRGVEEEEVEVEVQDAFLSL